MAPTSHLWASKITNVVSEGLRAMRLRNKASQSAPSSVPVRAAPRLAQPAWEAVAFAQPGDCELDHSRPAILPPLAAAVARVHPVRAQLAIAGTADRVSLSRHELPRRRRDHLADHVIAVLAAEELAQPLKRVHRAGVDHRDFYSG